jgi:hypothetical protein
MCSVTQNTITSSIPVLGTVFNYREVFTFDLTNCAV